LRDHTLHYGDLHWHTHYSDNRDRATVEAMVQSAKRFGYTILGTGDHNHNVTAADWVAECDESGQVQLKNPDIVLLNNCEMTFLIGHFLVIQPELIDGTIDEAHDFLFGDRAGVIMINHPGLPSDQWKDYLLPHANAVEVVNGGVQREAAAEGFTLDGVGFPLGIPAIDVYMRYIEAGIPVAAIGSSDAHALSELGHGATGFWIAGDAAKGAPAVAEVIDAIVGRRTFAASDSGMMLTWELTGDSTGHTLHVSARASGTDVMPRVDVYRGRSHIARLEGGRERSAAAVHLDNEGIYWIVARADDRFAVSSAIEVPADRKRTPPGMDPGPLEIYRSRVRFAPHRDTELQTVGDAFEIFCESEAPTIVDALGVEVNATVLETVPPRIVIDKSAGPEALEEFFTWFERNEIHEYRFDNVEIDARDGLVTLSATMIPAWADRRRGLQLRYASESSRLRTLSATCSRSRIIVSVPARCRIRVERGEYQLPFRTSACGSVPEGRIYRVAGSDGSSRLEQYFLPV